MTLYKYTKHPRDRDKNNSTAYDKNYLGMLPNSYVLRCPENTSSASVSSRDPLHDAWVGASDRLHGGDPGSGANVNTPRAITMEV